MVLTLLVARVEERSRLAARRGLGIEAQRHGKFELRGLRTAQFVGSSRSLGQLSAAVSLALLDGKIGRSGQDTTSARGTTASARRATTSTRGTARRANASAQGGVKEAQIHSRIGAV